LGMGLRQVRTLPKQVLEKPRHQQRGCPVINAPEVRTRSRAPLAKSGWANPRKLSPPAFGPRAQLTVESDSLGAHCHAFSGLMGVNGAAHSQI
jgi:hypothetical protein